MSNSYETTEKIKREILQHMTLHETSAMITKQETKLTYANRQLTNYTNYVTVIPNSHL